MAHLPRLTLLPLLLHAAWAWGFAEPDTARYRLELSTELKVFPHSTADPRQDDHALSVAALGRADYSWNGGQTQLAVAPFVRHDAHDPERSHVDLREFELRHRSGDLDWRAGIGKVFWGTTEFVHLVDVINQTDQVEAFDGEDKLGQPLLGLSWTSPVGVWSGFVLPYFRERTLPGVHGRLRAELPYTLGPARYTSPAARHHLDAAVRWSYSADGLDLGLAHFAGTAREPRFVLDTGGTEPTLVPLYEQMHQTSLDLNWAQGNWLWKLEALHNRRASGRYRAAIGGFEYTLPTVDSDAPEVGLLAELAWDSRRRRPDAPVFENDLFLGVRYALNDLDSTELLAGVGRDLRHGSHLLSLDASRRIHPQGRLSFKLRWLDSTRDADPLFPLRREDHWSLEYTHHF